LELLSRSKN